MKSRRNVLSAALALTGTAAVSRSATPPRPAAAVSAHPPGDLRELGLIANDPGAASANTAALKALVDPAGKFRGNLWFPNTTGSDTYFFNDIIPFHDGISLDLQGCVLHFSKAGERADTCCGFIFAIRDFSIANGSIVVDYQTGGGGVDAGNALTFGNRGDSSRYFSPLYDSKLSTSMGNITVRNLRISSNTKGGIGIYMIGGLNGVVMENVWLDGGGALSYGIYYEFGWATNEAKRELRQTSHAHNMRFSNINISNISTEQGCALTFAGAYNCCVDGLYVKSAKILFSCTPGESGFYRPWIGVDQIGAKRNIALRNIVGSGITGTAIAIAGASSKAGGYLHATNNTAVDQSDLIDCSIDGFAIDGGNLGSGFGIQSSAEKLDIRNGRISQFVSGLATTDDCTRLTIDSVDIVGCRQFGMQIGQKVSVWNPPRQKMGFIRNCFIAGNSAGAPGNFAAIELDECAAFIIEGNRFGHEPGYDGAEESTQGYAVRLGSRAHNVVCRCNHTGGIRDGGVAYANLSGPGTQGNTILNASGNSSRRGSWDGAAQGS